MIGAKKLSTVRQELQRALEATGDDPIRWLEQRMTARECQGAAGEDEVLHSLRRFLQARAKEKRRTQRVSTKIGRAGKLHRGAKTGLTKRSS